MGSGLQRPWSQRRSWSPRAGRAGNRLGITRGRSRWIEFAACSSCTISTADEFGGTEEEHFLVHIGDHTVGEPEEALHHALIQERRRGAGVLGLHAEAIG